MYAFYNYKKNPKNEKKQKQTKTPNKTKKNTKNPKNKTKADIWLFKNLIYYMYIRICFVFRRWVLFFYQNQLLILSSTKTICVNLWSDKLYQDPRDRAWYFTLKSFHRI